MHCHRNSQIDDAVRNGDRIDAIDRATGDPATRYIDPSTGQSVVVNNRTGEIKQVGGPGFKFGPESGDVPGASVRPPPFQGPVQPEVPLEPEMPPNLLEDPLIILDFEKWIRKCSGKKSCQNLS